MKESILTELLPTGKENAISSSDLCKKLGLSSARDLRRLVSKERANGAVILSAATGGYYLSSDRVEIEEFIRTVDAKAKNTMKALTSAKLFLRQIEGQESFDINTLQNLKGK